MYVQTTNKHSKHTNKQTNKLKHYKLKANCKESDPPLKHTTHNKFQTYIHTYNHILNNDNIPNIHTYIHTYLQQQQQHTYLQQLTTTYIHTYIHTYILTIQPSTFIQTTTTCDNNNQINRSDTAYMSVLIPLHTCMHACIHPYIDFIHTYISWCHWHTYIHFM